MDYRKKIILSLIVGMMLFLFIGICTTSYGMFSICIMKVPLKGLEGVNYRLLNLLAVITLGIFFIFSIPTTFLDLALSIGLKFIRGKKTIAKVMTPEALKYRNNLVYINIIAILCIALFGSSYYKGNSTFFIYSMLLPCLFCLSLCVCISYSIKLNITGNESKKFRCFLSVIASFIGTIGVGITIFFSIFLPFNGFNTVPRIWSIIYTCCILLSTIIISVMLLSLSKLIQKNKVSINYLRGLRILSNIGYMLIIIKLLTLVKVFFLIEQHSKQFFLIFIIKSFPFTISIFICSLTLASLKILLQKNNNL